MEFELYLKHIGQPVLILDKLLQVLALNPSFSELFPKVQKSEHIAAFLDVYPELQPVLSREEGQYPLVYKGRTYTAHISYLHQGRKRRRLARCVLLFDITDTVDILMQTREQSGMLRQSIDRIEKQNEQLRQRIRLEEESAALRAQALLLRDIHDTLGHTLTVLGALHNLSLNSLPDAEAARAKLRESLRLTNISIVELESAGHHKTLSIVSFLQRLRDSMARVSLTVVLHITGKELPLHRYMYADLARICQEAATNTLKHSNATRFDVYCDIGIETVTLRMEDNGSADHPIGIGHGLTNMDERVNNLFGDFQYGKTESGGFFVSVVVPVISDDGE